MGAGDDAAPAAHRRPRLQHLRRGPRESARWRRDGDDSDAEPTEPTDAPAPERRDREYVSLQQDEDGSWRLHGRLDADHGAIVDAALSEARDRLFREGLGDVTWADAIVDIAERSLDRSPLERRERFRINLFLDPAASPTATWINGIGVPEAITRLCTCDGTISPVFVDDSRPVSVGRSQRIVPDRTRRAVLHRDKKCRNPLCGATRGLEVHHVVHWHDLGGTDTWNLIALCRRCHRDHHLGRLDISGNADLPDGITFRDEARPGHRHRHPRGETTRAATRTAAALPASPRGTPPTVGDSVQPVTPGHELTCDQLAFSQRPTRLPSESLM